MWTQIRLLLFASILNSSVMLGNYLQQTTSADNIFRCIFFLGALRLNALFTAEMLLNSLHTYIFVVCLCCTHAKMIVSTCAFSLQVKFHNKKLNNFSRLDDDCPTAINVVIIVPVTIDVRTFKPACIIVKHFTAF